MPTLVVLLHPLQQASTSLIRKPRANCIVANKWRASTPSSYVRTAVTALTWALVELVGRYSNPDKWGHLTDTTRALAEPALDTEIGRKILARPSSRPTRPWPVVDRLGEQTVRELLRDRRTGVMQRVLAERYGISVSSVKRILQSHPA